jgi:hypothetical protein
MPGRTQVNIHDYLENTVVNHSFSPQPHSFARIWNKPCLYVYDKTADSNVLKERQHLEAELGDHSVEYSRMFPN